MGKLQRRGRCDQSSMRNDRSRGKTGYREKRLQRDTEDYGSVVPIRKDLFVPKTDRQRVLAATIKAMVCTFALGVAGTGKSHTALSVGCELLVAGSIDKIVCLKPAAEIDSELGILPGGKDEKLAVLYNPMRQLLTKLLGKSYFENLVSNEKILFEPLGSVLGMTYENALIVVDEAQYTTPGQMKVILTRLGEHSKIVLCGDYKEQRLEPGLSGLEDAYDKLGKHSSVGVIEFELDDIVRSGFTRVAIEAYRK